MSDATAPFFSVVIPLYNKENEIGDTIRSILGQDFADFELIVVDDGSTDDSLQIVRTFDDERLACLSQANGGVSSARNRGIEAARGEFIAFLDGDDLWLPDHLATLHDLAGKYPEVKVFTTGYRLSCEPHVCGSPDDYPVEDYFDAARKSPVMCSITIAVHRSCFDTAGLFDPRISRGEDIDMWCRLARHYRIVKSDLVTAIYKTDAQNRACINTRSNLTNSCVSHFDIGHAGSRTERDYYLHVIAEYGLKLLRAGQIRTFATLLVKYKQNLLPVLSEIVKITYQHVNSNS